MKPEETQSGQNVPAAYQILGTCDRKVWGRNVSELLEQVLLRAGLEPIQPESDAFPKDGNIAIFRVDYFFDRWAVQLILSTPDSVIVECGDAGNVRPVAVFCAAEKADRWRELLLGEAICESDLPDGVKLIDAEHPSLIFNDKLRKQSRPLILALDDETRREIERKTFALAYKGVTDFVTKYVFPRPAFHATRMAAEMGLKPNTVTAASLLLVFVVLYLFSEGQFALGLGVGFLMSFLDTVDGKLARVTQTSTAFGNRFDHSIDMIHPPLWWLAWWSGVDPAPEPSWWNAAGMTAVFGYIALRLQEWHFRSAFGVRIHTWQQFDSRFRLFTSRRNTNLVLLAIATAFGRPDLGLAWVALWTLGSLGIHGVRWIQGWLEFRRSGPLGSWLESAPAN